MIDLKSVKKIIIPEGVVKKIVSAGVTLWEIVVVSLKNWVKFSTEDDSVTIYNNGLGYKNGFRVRSGGVEASQANCCAIGYIPFVKGDKLYIYPRFTGLNTNNAVNFYTSSFECLGQITDTPAFYGFCTKEFKTNVIDDVSVLDISDITVSRIDEVAYVRITNAIGAIGGKSTAYSGAEMVITKNEKITAWDIETYKKNWISYSKEADDKTIYNGGLGYKNNTCLNSNAEEVTLNDYVTIGYIPIKAGDVVRVKGIAWDSSKNEGSYFWTFDSSYTKQKNKLPDDSGSGDITFVAEDNDVTAFILGDNATNVAYIRFSAYGNGENVIVTVNEKNNRA